MITRLRVRDDGIWYILEEYREGWEGWGWWSSVRTMEKRLTPLEDFIELAKDYANEKTEYQSGGVVWEMNLTRG